jgi:hypothetical protein
VGAKLTNGVNAKIIASLNKVDPETILAIAVSKFITDPPRIVGNTIKAKITKKTASTGKLNKLLKNVRAQLL